MANISCDEDKLDDVLREIRSLRKDVDSAFLRDESGDVDYVGHRMFHKTEQVNEKNTRQSIADFKKNIYTWIAIGILTIISSTFVKVYIEPVLSLINKA